MQQESEVPEGWEWCRLGEICEIVMGNSPPGISYNADGEGIPLINGPAEFSKGPFGKTVILKYTTEPTKLCKENDLLICVRGSTTGRTNIAGSQACIGRGVALIRADVFQGYLNWYIHSNQKKIYSLGTGSTFPSISYDDISELAVPLPPLPEQHRIAAAIEALFARLDAANARLERVPGILKQFRQAVLAAACDGRLTEGWRVSQIVVGKRSDINSQSNKLLQREHLPVLPSSWIYCHTELILAQDRPGIKTGPFGSMLKKHEHRNEGIPVFGIENVRSGKFIPGSKIHISPEKAHELSNYDALPGDILISRSGTVGEICIVPDKIGEARFSSNIMRVCLDREKILPEYCCELFQGSNLVRSQISSLCGGSTRDFLNGRILRSLVIPLPPLSEQYEIVRRVDSLFALVDQIETRVAAARERADTLRQSILAQAFSGRLVPTEAELARQEGREYEPASVLLERVCSEKKEKTGRRGVQSTLV